MIIGLKVYFPITCLVFLLKLVTVVLHCDGDVILTAREESRGGDEVLMVERRGEFDFVLAEAKISSLLMVKNTREWSQNRCFRGRRARDVVKDVGMF